MLEIEQKYVDVDVEEIRSRLVALGAEHSPLQVEEDHYFNAADRDFKTTGEAFRIRRVGEQNWLTYKGPRTKDAVKIRTELEIALRDGGVAKDEMTQLLIHLGFRPVAVVRKQREMYHLVRHGLMLTVCLDQVEELGCYAEVEVLAEENCREAARDALLELANLLGLDRVEGRSYLTMLLARRGE